MAELEPGEIRRGEAVDADNLAALAARTFHATFAAANRPEDMAAYLAEAFGPTQQLAQLIAPAIRTLLVDRGGLIGFAQLRTSEAPPCVISPAPIELWRFYIDPSWHGRGVAQRLMRAVVAEATATGAQSLWLGVWERNPRAIAFYRKSGFIEVGAHDFPLGQDLQTDLIMVLRLPPGSRPSGMIDLATTPRG